uniref:Limb region 1 protein n=2 Tax=Ascaris suum TaxID=6253 RepID=F1KVP9_ASCSU
MEVSEEFDDEREQRFHQFVRQHIICLLLFITLYLISRWILGLLKTCSDNDELYAGKEDFFVFRISLWMCTCSLAISIGAAMLLPFSVIGSEILQAYPDSYYFQWLNWPLIHSLWNYVFALSNLSLFVLLPFAYFFIESQGFRGQGKGIMARVYETVAVCIMLIVVLICLADVVQSFLLFQQKSISLSLLSFTSVDLPFIYSCVSLIGVFTLLITTPIGFAHMFTVVSNHLLASNSSPTMDPNEHVISRLEYETQKLRLVRNGCPAGSLPLTPPEPFLPQKPLRGYQKVLQSVKYPLAIIILLLLTAVSVLMVLINTLQLLFGYRALPVYAQYIEVNSRHTFGVFGALVEVIIISYLMVASLVGVYSVPLLRRLRPRKGKTTMTFIIANCTTVLVLSSALPVLARTLGITTFDLLGAYGSFNWLSNFTLVWTYNVAFAIATVSCLVNHFTTPVRREVIRRVKELSCRRRIEEFSEKTE